MDQNGNDHLILICGESSTGKSASLSFLDNPEGVVYLNCEAGKKLPFQSKFKEVIVTDPYVVETAFTQAEEHSEIHTIIIDSLTFLMDMYESLYVIGSTNTMKAWSDYAQFFKNLMQQRVAPSSKNVIFTAHTLATLNELEMVMEKKIPIKGALKNNGVEAYFSTIVSAKKLPLTKLDPYQNSLLTVNPEEEMLGYKYVYQTRVTKETVNERIRSSMGMWSINETYIDNNAQFLLNKLHEYYN